MSRSSLSFTAWICALACGLASCSKHDTPPSPPPVDVYVAGSVYGATAALATWWKNGVPFTTGLSTGLTNSRAFAMTVSGNDVYLAGVQFKQGMGAVATYWKNGQPFPLMDGVMDSRATGIALIGSDVYTVGYRLNAGNGQDKIAICWKNSQPVYLSDTVHSSMVATCVAVSGSDVYVAGSLNGYWKNGQPVLLNTDAIGFNAISVAGGDVYMAGNGGAPFPGVAMLWKNGVPAVMNEPEGTENQSSNASAMVMSDGKVFLAGGGHATGGAYAARYWENGKPVDIFNDYLAAGITGIAVNGTDVYVAGSRFVQSYGAYVASYWKNGVPVDVNGANPADLQCIYLVKR